MNTIVEVLTNRRGPRWQYGKCKPAASALKYCDWMKVVVASLRVGFCNEWKRA